MKRRVLLVDDEMSILLVLKTVLEINGFDVDTATSAFEGKRRIKQYEYEMVITDMRMENDAAGVEVIAYARTAPYKPAVALLTAFPIAEDDWQGMGADEMLVKPMQTQILLAQIEALLVTHQDKKQSAAALKRPVKKAAKKAAKKPAVKKSTKKAPAKKASKKPVKKAARKSPPKKKPSARKTVKKSAAKKKSGR